MSIISEARTAAGEGAGRLGRRHALPALALSLVAAAALAIVHAAASTSPDLPVAEPRGAPPDLAGLLAKADPAVLQIASAAVSDAAPQFGPRPLGWERLDLDHPPRLDLGGGSSEPGLSPAGPPAQPFVLKGKGRDAAVQCLASAIYYEAALEPREGQEAVAQVVLNRVRHDGYPKSVCGVVFQGSDRPGCQFTFACDGSMARAPVPWAWRRAREVAERALSGHVQPEVGMATHYYADWIAAPPWSPRMIRVAQIGQHLFFRPAGAAGQPAAFRLAYEGGETSASKTWLIGRPQPALLTAPQALTDGGLVAPRSIVQDGRVIALPPGTVYLGRVKGDIAHGGTIEPTIRAPSRLPPMHAMVLMRGAAERAVRAAEAEQARLRAEAASAAAG